MITTLESGIHIKTDFIRIKDNPYNKGTKIVIRETPIYRTSYVTDADTEDTNKQIVKPNIAKTVDFRETAIIAKLFVIIVANEDTSNKSVTHVGEIHKITEIGREEETKIQEIEDTKPTAIEDTNTTQTRGTKATETKDTKVKNRDTRITETKDIRIRETKEVNNLTLRDKMETGEERQYNRIYIGQHKWNFLTKESSLAQLCI